MLIVTVSGDPLTSIIPIRCTSAKKSDIITCRSSHHPNNASVSYRSSFSDSSPLFPINIHIFDVSISSWLRRSDYLLFFCDSRILGPTFCAIAFKRFIWPIVSCCLYVRACKCYKWTKSKSSSCSLLVHLNPLGISNAVFGQLVQNHKITEGGSKHPCLTPTSHYLYVPLSATSS